MNQDVKALPVVAHVESWLDDYAALGIAPDVQWCELPAGTRFVRLSDAESALAELRAEVAKAVADAAEIGRGYLEESHRADTAEARLERAMQKLQVARDALAGGLWDYGPGQDEHQRCNEVIADLDAFLGEGK